MQYGLDQGFGSYENVTIESEAFLAFRHLTAYRLAAWLRPTLATTDRGAVVSDKAVTWLRRRTPSDDARVPFFLWLHYVDPHAPYSTATLNKSFRGDSLIGAGGDGGPVLQGQAPEIARLRSGEVRLGKAEKSAMRELYR